MKKLNQINGVAFTNAATPHDRRMVDSSRRSAAPALVAAALLVVVGATGFWVMRGQSHVPEGAKRAVAEPTSAPDVQRPAMAPSAPMAVVSPAAPAARAASSAVARTVPPWQKSLRPAMVAATRVDSLVAYQAQLEQWTCEGERCLAQLRIPPTAPGGQNMSSAANIFNGLQKQMALAGIDVALSSIQRQPQGMAVALQFTPSAAAQGRFFTYAEIASIRLDMMEQGLKSHCEAPAH